MKCPVQPLIFPADFDPCLYPLNSQTSYVFCMMGYLDLDTSAELQEWRHPFETFVFGSPHPEVSSELLEG